MMLRDEVDGGVLPRRERRAVDEAPEFAVVENQRILHRRQLRVDTNLVFVQIFAPDETALVIRFFRVSLGVVTSYLSALDAVATNLLERLA